MEWLIGGTVEENAGYKLVFNVNVQVLDVRHVEV
jgi:hypothetical protein